MLVESWQTRDTAHKLGLDAVRIEIRRAEDITRTSRRCMGDQRHFTGGAPSRFARCLFLRVLTYSHGVSAVLVSLSENDGCRVAAKLECLVISPEVPTIPGSLGRISEGFRFMRPC